MLLQGGVSKHYSAQTCCVNELGLTEDECMDAVMNNETSKHYIETKTTSYIQAYTLIEAIIPCILSLFIGPWTDENGRKWPIVRSLSGMLGERAHETNFFKPLVRVLPVTDPDSCRVFGIIIGRVSRNLVLSPAIYFRVCWRWISDFWCVCVQVSTNNNLLQTQMTPPRT